MQTALIAAMLTLATNPNATEVKLVETRTSHLAAGYETPITVGTLVFNDHGFSEPAIIRSSTDRLSQQADARRNWHTMLGGSEDAIAAIDAKRWQQSKLKKQQQTLNRKDWYLHLQNN